MFKYSNIKNNIKNYLLSSSHLLKWKYDDAISQNKICCLLSAVLWALLNLYSWLLMWLQPTSSFLFFLWHLVNLFISMLSTFVTFTNIILVYHLVWRLLPHLLLLLLLMSLKNQVNCHSALPGENNCSPITLFMLLSKYITHLERH